MHKTKIEQEKVLVKFSCRIFYILVGLIFLCKSVLRCSLTIAQYYRRVVQKRRISFVAFCCELLLV